MAGAIQSPVTNNTKHQKLAAEKNQQDKDKLYHHFLYKAALVAVFFVILPLFPSQAPEFINQSLVTRNWELLHILFVGIAISYGLFSRRHDETDKENANPRLDNAQSLVARFLQVSSFFEDHEADQTPSEFSDETTKVQTWSNQHYRNQPVVVVAPPHENKVSAGGISSMSIGEKPLLLPVRSLKSRLCDDEDDAVVVQPQYNNRSNSYKVGSNRFSSNSIKARNAELEGPGSGGNSIVMEKMKDNVVLPSPIPWRSRSGKFEPKQDQVETLAAAATPQYGSSSKASMEESEFSKVESRPLKSSSQISRSNRTSPVLYPAPKLMTPSPPPPPPPLVSSESLAKSAEDVVRNKKGFYKSCPPPPPPPPLPMFQKSISMKPIRYGSSFNEGCNNNSSFDKELKRSLTSEGNNKSKGKWSRSFVADEKNLASFSKGEKEKEVVDHGEEHFMEEPIIGKGYENMQFRTDKFMGHSSVHLVEEQEKDQSFLDRMTVETDDDDDEDTETEYEDNVEARIMMQKESVQETPPPTAEGSKPKNEPSSSGSFGGDEGPDVDKKADEFIAKFREQIRLQRIESIKRSTRNARNSSR